MAIPRATDFTAWSSTLSTQGMFIFLLHDGPRFYDEKHKFTDLYRNTMWKNMSNRYLRNLTLLLDIILVLIQEANCLKYRIRRACNGGRRQSGPSMDRSPA